jgi:biopolymer transport protein ExbD
MLRKPSGRRSSKNNMKKLNLIPILDAVFIFIFFLLMTANFIKIYEIGSDVPIISTTPPPKTNKKPLALTVQINANSIIVKTGLPSRVRKKIGKNELGKYDLETLHNYLVGLKKKWINDEDAIFEPKINLTYEELVEVMDAVRMMKNTDDSIYKKNKDGMEEKVKTLFSKIVFSDLGT